MPDAGAYLAADYLDPAAPAAPAFTIGTKLVDAAAAADDASPGPGAFQLPELPRGPCYSMAGRAVAAEGDAAADGLPGPGAYGVAEAAAAVAGAAPAWTMGVRLKEASGGLWSCFGCRITLWGVGYEDVLKMCAGIESVLFASRPIGANSDSCQHSAASS